MLTGSRWRNCATVRLWGAVGLLSCKGMTVSPKETYSVIILIQKFEATDLSCIYEVQTVSLIQPFHVQIVASVCLIQGIVSAVPTLHPAC